MIAPFFMRLQHRRWLTRQGHAEQDVWITPWVLDSRAYVGVERRFLVVAVGRP